MKTVVFKKYKQLEELPYLIFEFPNFYPEGGWNDFVGFNDDLDKIINGCEATDRYAKDGMEVFMHVVDSKSFLVVLKGHGFYDLMRKEYKWEWERLDVEFEKEVDIKGKE